MKHSAHFLSETFSSSFDFETFESFIVEEKKLPRIFLFQKLSLFYYAYFSSACGGKSCFAIYLRTLGLLRFDILNPGIRIREEAYSAHLFFAFFYASRKYKKNTKLLGNLSAKLSQLRHIWVLPNRGMFQPCMETEECWHMFPV